MSPRSRSVALFTAFGIVGLLTLLGWIRLLAVDLLFYDEWGFLKDFIDNYVRGGIGRYDLFAAHNDDHRIVTTRLAYILSYHLDGLDRVNAAYWNGVFAALILTLWALLLSGLYPASVGMPLPVILAAAFLSTSAAQYENWTWGFQVQWFHNVFFVLLTALLITSGGGRAYAALFSAVVASFTLSCGLFVWIAGALTLALRLFVSRVGAVFLGIWTVAGLGTWAFYYHGVHGPAVSFGLVLKEPAALLHTFLALIGAPVARFEVDYSPFLGAAGLALALFYTGWVVTHCVRPDNRPDLTPHLRMTFLLAYTMMSAAAISAARHPLGGARYVVENGSRYTTLTSVLWVAALGGLFALERRAASPRPWLSRCLYSFFGMAVMSFALSTDKSLEDWRHRSGLLARARDVIVQTDPELLGERPEVAEALRPLGISPLETLRLLHAERLSPYASLSPPPNLAVQACPVGACGYVDEIAVQETAAGPVTKIRGWAVDKIYPPKAPRSILFVAGGSVLGSTKPTEFRKDLLAGLPGSDGRLGWSYFKKGRVTDVRTLAVSRDGISVFELPFSAH